MRAPLVPVAFGIVGLALACGGSTPPAATPAAAPACAVPVELANQSRLGPSDLDRHARLGAHGALADQRACARPLSLAFALDAPGDEPGVLRIALHLGVSERGALVASSSVTLRIPKPVSDADLSSAIAKAAGVLTRNVVGNLR